VTDAHPPSPALSGADSSAPPAAGAPAGTGTTGPARRRRHRSFSIAGEDLGRIVSLSDGVFAFALTLLVLSLTVPTVTSNGALGLALRNDYGAFFGYGFAFVMIGIWWIVHNRTFQYIVKFDSTLVWLNLMLLAQIAVMPFTLTVYADYSQAPHDFQYAVDLFAAIQITLGITTALIWEYARRAQLTKPDVPAAVSRYFTNRGLASSGVFALSIGISFFSVDWAQYSWFLIVVVLRMLTVEGD
jgi:uncharacterized membrane protein